MNHHKVPSANSAYNSVSLDRAAHGWGAIGNNFGIQVLIIVLLIVGAIFAIAGA